MEKETTKISNKATAGQTCTSICTEHGGLWNCMCNNCISHRKWGLQGLNGDTTRIGC